MGIKRFPAVIALIIIACILFSACEIKIPLLKEETTAPEQSTTEPTTAAPDFTAYSRAYGEYLLELIDSGKNLAGYTYDTDSCLFLLLDLDDSGVPELLISEDDKQASKVDIYTYDGYKVVFAGSAGEYGSFEFSESDRLIKVDSDTGEQETISVYSFENSTLTLRWEGITLTEDGAEESRFINGETQPVDAQTFEEQLQANVPAETVSTGRNGWPLTKKNAALVLSGSREGFDTETEQESGGENPLDAYKESAAPYKDFLLEKAKNEDGNDRTFTFRYIDDNDTSELIVFQGSAASSAAEIYTLSDDEVRLICTAGSQGQVYCGSKNSLAAGVYSSEGTENIIVYRIDGLTASTEWTGESVSDAGSGEITECTSDGEQVTADEYTQIKDGYFSDGTLELLSYNGDGTAELTESAVNEFFE